MKIRLAMMLGLLALAGLSGCSSDRGKGCNAAGNPLDAELCAEFEGKSYEPVQAADEELCTRLAVDLLGSRPTRDEIAQSCAGRDIHSVVRAMQRTEEYRVSARRRWADRFQYSEYIVDVHSIHELDALVDDLYRSRITYPDFAVLALAHPGFVGRFIGYGQPEMAADAAFTAFLGRRATTPEASDLAALYRPWSSGGVFEDMPPAPGVTAGGGDGNGETGPYYGYGMVPFIDPFACEAGVRSCTSELLGHAEVAFPRNGREMYLSPDQLTDDDWEALRAPGRLFVTLPMFWEAEVDATLKAFLGYDLGSMRPAARQALVRWFKATGGNVPLLERAVLTSWAYRQSAVETTAFPRPDGLKNEPIAFGPTKLMTAEAWLFSVAKLTGTPVGNCDWRYPNLPDWYYPGDPLLDAELEDVYPRDAYGEIDATFRDTAAKMGGCPGGYDFGSFGARSRSNQMGLMTAVAQEEAVIDLCLVKAAPALIPEGIAASDGSPAAIRATVRHLLESTQGHEIAGAEVEDVVNEAAAGCVGCTAESVARDLCTGLAGGIEYVFY